MTIRLRPIQRAKTILRKQLIERLTAVTDSEKRVQSLIVQKMLFDLPIFLTSNRISCYVNNNILVYTEGIIRRIFIDQKMLFVPRHNIRKGTLDMLLIDSQKDYERLPVSKYYKIRQPKYSDLREEAIDSGGLDIIIVPGLAFTKGGKRLGYGAGFYDNYFKRFDHVKQTRPVLIGLAYKQQVFPYLPTHMHDVNVDVVLYPP